MNAEQMTMTMSLLGALILMGCAPLSPNLDEQFGRNLNSLKAMQTLNPDAASRHAEAPPMDARAAREAVNTYNAGFRSPERVQNVFTLGMGR